MTAAGKVYLVGAGPGDPRLITVRAIECLQAADVVLYDALVNERVLDHAPAAAERRLVGKRHGRVTVEQVEIERLLVEHARAGRTVVRLKGGDPFIFGRGGEEAEACMAAGVPFEVVPGVTSAIAVPAYAGIPLTHREHSSAVTFITGQPGPAREGSDHDWQALVRAGGTLVFLMAMLRCRGITAELVAAGMAADTPAAVVRWGTTPRQRTVRGVLADIAERADAAGLRPPVVLVVGEVAALADRIAWYESLPLFGKRIVVTRARHQAGELAAALTEAGAEVVEYPVIEIAEPADPDALTAAYSRVGEYDWLVLTSVNGARRFLEGLLAGGHDIRELAGVRIAAIGPATAGAVREHGLHVAAQPDRYVAEALLEALGEVRGQRLLLARAAVARELLPDRLRERGAEVDVVATYQTILPRGVPAPRTLGEVDMVTFTSASTVVNFDELCDGRSRGLLAGRAVAAIGPITAAALRERGIEPDVVPDSYTIADLAAAVVRHFANGQALK
jgi:uroporphyrinogen III methyltransferase/synthase